MPGRRYPRRVDQGAAASQLRRPGDRFEIPDAEDLQRGRVHGLISGRLGLIASMNFSPNWLVSCWVNSS